MKNKSVKKSYLTKLLESDKITRKDYNKAKIYVAYRSVFVCVITLIIVLPSWCITQLFINNKFNNEIGSWLTLVITILGMVFLCLALLSVFYRFSNQEDDLILIKDKYLHNRTNDEFLQDRRTKKRWKRVLILFIAILFLCPTIIKEINNHKADEIYVQAEALIWNEQDYEGAKKLLESIEIDYKDKEPLIVYCQAKIDYLNGNLEDAFLSQDDMIFGYQTEEHFNRIGAFKEVLDYEYQEYLDEKYPDKKEESVIPETTTRYHYKPSYTPDDDPYDIDRYRNEEDFYYDNYENFIDYYEAEKYFKEHKK